MRWIHYTVMAACVSLATAACDHANTTSKRVSTAMEAFQPVGRPAARNTTDPTLAINNLNVRIRGLERRLKAQPGDLSLSKTLLSQLIQRSSTLGQFDDLDRIAELGEAMVQATPDRPDAYLARASAHAARHLFAEAFADLDKARELGGSAHQIDAQRATLLGATGKHQLALDIMQPRASAHPNIASLGYVGHLLGRLGRHAEAEAAFELAQQSYRDVSPFAVADLYFEWGLMRHEADDKVGAMVMYRAALARLPLHAHASVHLAELAPAEEGIPLLERLLAQVNEPEATGLLADRLSERDPTRSAALLLRAKQRYRELSERHPLAFADHAGWFWLGPGADAHEAMKRAEMNLAARQNDEAYALYLESAQQLGLTDKACAAADKALAARYVRPSLRRTAADVYRACGQPAAATRALGGGGS